jgi:predicted amidophosphoribosyltransferase
VRQHNQWHKGKTKVCPVCGKELIAPEYEMCWNCLGEEKKEEIERRKAVTRKLLRVLRRDAKKKYMDKMKKESNPQK